MVPILLTCALDAPPLCGATLSAGDQLRVAYHAQGRVPDPNGAPVDIASHLEMDVKVATSDARGATWTVRVRHASGTWPQSALQTHPWQGHRYGVRWDGSALTVTGGRLTPQERGRLTDDIAQAMSSAGISFPPAVGGWSPPTPGASVPMHATPWLYNVPGSGGGTATYVGRRDAMDQFQVALHAVDASEIARATLDIVGDVAVDPARGWVRYAVFDGTIQVEAIAGPDGARGPDGAGKLSIATSVEVR